MKVLFLDQFARDLSQVRDQKLKDQVFEIIVRLERAKSLRDVPNVRKLKGYRTNYRIRVGNYRIGFKFEYGVVELARFLDRKDIYRFYP